LSPDITFGCICFEHEQKIESMIIEMNSLCIILYYTLINSANYELKVSSCDSSENMNNKARGAGHGAQSAGHRAQGTGHRAQGSGRRAQGSGRRARGTEREARGTGLRARGSGHGAQGSGRRVISGYVLLLTGD